MTTRRRSPTPTDTLKTRLILEEIRDYLNIITERVLDLPTRAEWQKNFDRVDRNFDRLHNKFDRIDDTFAANETKLQARFDRVDEKFARIDDQFEATKARFDRMDEKFADFQNQVALLIEASARQTREDIRSLRQDLANQSQASELRVLDRRVTVLEQQRVGG